MSFTKTMVRIGLILSVTGLPVLSAQIQPLFRTVDLNVGEQQNVQLANNQSVSIRLASLDEETGDITNAIRKARVRVEVNGEELWLISSTYHLPKTVGAVRIDCPVTRGYTVKSGGNVWELYKDARLRVWPKGSPFVRPGTFYYPITQKWFASMTQMGNEPVYVNAGETPGADRIYYHSGLDFGGAEGLTQVVSAVDGIVISAGPETAEHLGEEGTSRADVVYLKDHRGWYYLYSHLYSIDDTVVPGQEINMGDPIGLVGKEGSSGGWAHLHFGVSTHMSSGEKGALDAYPFIWQAYQEQHQPAIMAVARPHKATWTGQKVELDASGSWSQTGTITSYEWTFCDGSTGSGAQISKVYTSPGEYSEMVKVSDSEGHAAFDFAVVIIADPDTPERKVPRIHLTHEPTQNIHVGDEIVFKVRSMNSPPVNEEIDFGDNSPIKSFQSDGNIDFKNPNGYAVVKHRYTAQGDYIVTASRSDPHGQQAVARVWITVDDGP